MSSASSAKAKFQHGLETFRSRGEGISVKDRLLRNAYGRRLEEACAILELFCAHLERCVLNSVYNTGYCCMVSILIKAH